MGCHCLGILLAFQTGFVATVINKTQGSQNDPYVPPECSLHRVALGELL